MAHLKIGNPSKGAVSAACLKQLYSHYTTIVQRTCIIESNHKHIICVFPLAVAKEDMVRRVNPCKRDWYPFERRASLVAGRWSMWYHWKNKVENSLTILNFNIEVKNFLTPKKITHTWIKHMGRLTPAKVWRLWILTNGMNLNNNRKLGIYAVFLFQKICEPTPLKSI
jgi:hypothetical protein